ncbi:hypothetical protein [Vulcanisaeta sp. JCM 14467]|uniref:hypothetical protein n=1 Tax=Vulcanisaeta sp. JCM 14467 TaxID=1295370 RepID=UPI0006D0ACAB|nr:hypothetical protein [Vulcanisaeta sp. JCM 14467]
MSQGVEVPLFGLARLLETIEEFSFRKGRDPYTRELLGYLRTWGYGEDLLLLALRLGLVERYDDYCDPRSMRVCRFNRVSGRGREFLRHYRELLRLVGDGGLALISAVVTVITKPIMKSIPRTSGPVGCRVVVRCS